VTEPETDDTTTRPDPLPARDDPLVTEQERKGYGEDEGEREQALDEE
jgi:hypothetical protein